MYLNEVLGKYKGKSIPDYIDLFDQDHNDKLLSADYGKIDEYLIEVKNTATFIEKEDGIHIMADVIAMPTFYRAKNETIDPNFYTIEDIEEEYCWNGDGEGLDSFIDEYYVLATEGR